MKRLERKGRRLHTSVGGVSEMVRLLDRSMRSAGIADSEKESFVNWAIGSLWKSFKEERMNQRIVIENEIKALGLRFPNGTVNKNYDYYFDLPTDKISDIELEGAGELGLKLDIRSDGQCSLIGKPTKTGDYLLKLRFKTINGEPASEIAIPIAFNPNPRSLWRNIATDKNIHYYKTDSDSEYIKSTSASGKTMLAASQRGRSHAQEGKPRDDHFSLYHCDKSDWYIMAVADGAGSAKYSRKGSEVACETVVEHCKELLIGNPEFEKAIHEYAINRDDKDKRTNVTRQVIDIVYRGAMKAHDAIKQIVKANEELKLKDFATTLMFAVCKKYEFGWFIASFWVGDGAMCIFDYENKSLKLLGTPDEGEFSGQTRFLTMPEIFHDPEAVAKRLRMAIVDDFTALVLMTDGVSDPMFETDKNLNDYTRWEDFFKKLRQGFPEDEIEGVDLYNGDEKSLKESLLHWLDFWSPGNHDDRTLALLY